MFALEVEYLMGRVFAGDFHDRSGSEWPPHPGRLFSALASAYFENGAESNERAALEWLELQSPPHLHAGEAGRVTAPVTAFVPINYRGCGLPIARKKQPRFFPAQGPSSTVVHFVWPNAVPSSDITEALDRLASRTGYLGKACSLVRMRVTETAPEPNYVPDGNGEAVLRIPGKGRLRELAWLFEADQRVSPGPQQRYRRADRGLSRAPAATGTEFGTMATFRKVSGPGLPIEGALTLAEAVRRALMSNAGGGGPMTELIHGHTGDTHCAIASLPFVGRKHADGHLMGFAVVLPKTASFEDRSSVLRACHAIEERGLHIPGVGEWKVEPTEEAALSHTLRPATWMRSSKVWATVTPILLDRFPKKKGPTVENIVCASCRRIGLPEPTTIEHGPYSSIEGVPPVPSFRLQRAGEIRARWGIHAKLEFGAEVRGPMMLGAGRYFGLGLLKPQWEQERNERD